MSFTRTSDLPYLEGTFKQAELVACYKDLAELFGEASQGSYDGKVSGQWCFIRESKVDGEVEIEFVSVYDWKATSLYDGSGDTVEEFRNLPSAEFSVGSHSKETAHSFGVWLKTQLQGKPCEFKVR